MLLLHCGVIVTQFLYALTLLAIAPSKWMKIEQCHRVPLKVCLGASRFAEINATLVEAQDSPLKFQAKAKVTGHLARLDRTRSCASLLCRFLESRNSQIRQLAVQFLQAVGGPSSIPVSFPDHTPREPLDIH